MSRVYKLHQIGGSDVSASYVDEDGKTTAFALSPGNADYDRYLEAVKNGAEVLAADPEPEPKPKIDTGNDVAADQDDKLADAVATLRDYIGLPTPTGPQSASALKLLIRLYLWDLKKRGF